MSDNTIKLPVRKYKIKDLLDNYHLIICMIEEEEMIQSTNDTSFFSYLVATNKKLYSKIC
jgi:hypothetical protein